MSGGSKGKIALFVSHDLTGLLLLNRILPGIQDMGYDPVIFDTGMHRNRNFKYPTPVSVAFFNATILNETLIPVLENRSVTAAPAYTYRQLASVYNTEYHEISDVNDPEFIQSIVKQDYHGAIALRFLQVFEQAAITAFQEKGFIWNLHSGLLPDYKGLLTPYRAIANHEKTYGMTLHDLNCGVDEGDIITKAELPLDKTLPVLDLYLNTVPAGAAMVLSTLQSYKNGQNIKSQPQENGPDSGHYYSNPSDEEFQRFLQAGIIYADPERAVKRIAAEFSFVHTVLRDNLERALTQKIKENPHTRLLVAPAGHAARRLSRIPA